MKNIKIAVVAITLAGGAFFSASAADGEYSITNDFPIQGINEGRLWVGNFGTNGGSLLSKSEVGSADWFQLFSAFRPNTSFALSEGLLTGLTNGELTGFFQVGNAINYRDDVGVPQGYTPNSPTQFAGQDLYFFALSSTSTSWNSTLLGNTYKALLLSMSSGFGDGDGSSGLSSYDISAGVDSNTAIIGSGSVSTVVSALVPEPTTASLFILGGMVALATRRRKI
jgi:hypothetical protein